MKGATAVIVGSVRLGPQRVAEEDIVDFPQGIPGFEGLNRYVLLAPYGEDSPVRVLQAVDDPAVSFIVTDPRAIRPDYTPVLQEADRQALGCPGPDLPPDVEVWAILTVHERPELMTVNLLAPVLINRSTRRGRQVVQVDTAYSVRHNVLEELERVAPGAGRAVASRPPVMAAGE